MYTELKTVFVMVCKDPFLGWGGGGVGVGWGWGGGGVGGGGAMYNWLLFQYLLLDTTLIFFFFRVLT